ncbi:hypothetical protein RAE19_17570 [Rhodoferax sp. TBRC 17660]|uniref:Uncharacterized protein n=1 Tax=Rhodoferax potami TaxID=3068338 RepID=A0ABU3KRX6_9BURK|nr:hypothetical protein [Rhodoferax sp. TBRC 17660]MDT7520497.1 hypothetical protein [Rhodoferax sp. TBRC 17660]
MPVAPHSVSLFDSRPFFEKALTHGIEHGLIGQDKLDAIRADAPKGMVQIARYFGTEYLRPELELARDRIVNLVSLHLAHSTEGDLHRAAELLRDHSFLSRSKAGSDMLKALITMPQTTHFGMNERSGFRDEHIPLLAKWSLKTLTEYQMELASRSRAAAVVDAAIWMAGQMGMDVEELEEAGKDAEAVIRTALLARACKRSSLPDWVTFEKMILALRKRYLAKPGKLPLIVPADLPSEWTELVESIRDSVWADSVKWLESDLSVRKLFDQTPAFMGRYFWLEDAILEVDQFDKNVSKAWAKATGGNDDESSLLTLFLCMAAGSPAKTVLTEKAASTLVKKIRKSGLQPTLPLQFIEANAPAEHLEDYASLWNNFIEESSATLASDHDYTFNDAVALLRRECNISR